MTIQTPVTGSTRTIVTAGAPKRHRHAHAERSTRETATKRLLYVVGGVLASLVFIVPLLLAVARAFQPHAVVTAPPEWATFFHFTWENFAQFASQSGLGRSILNSVIVSVATAVLTAFVATLAGYGFAKFRSRWLPWLFGAILVTMMIPFQAILTPLYIEMNTLGLTDSLFGLVLFYTTVNLPFCIFVMRNTFDAVPDELEEAALIDGARLPRILTSVVRPLIMPGVATSALYAFLASWTEFLGALTFLTDQDLFTLPVSMVNMQQGAYGQVNFGLIAAGAVVAMIPCVILYVSLQRFYVAGLASGSVKG
ncbi:carbohydrate ABC transporter permease [Microbacterium indicum]|uniref:carbohydrate ABC transporter permease n=1 Tax=Microbacterium indicum TaxID=358100 RepID=UPI000406F919|nr:carbohydrate ABC transporter permease [Microbacterium indicum]